MSIRWLLAAGLQVLLCGGVLAKELPADLRVLIEAKPAAAPGCIGC